MFEDPFEHAFHVCEHLVVPEPDDSVAGALDLLGSLGVERLPLIVAVGFAIHLDDEARGKADEVSDERSDHMLAAELKPAKLVGSKLPTQALFGIV